MVSLRCALGWHDSGVISHKLRQPWVFNMHCRRCGKHWTNTYWLPPQPITCNHPDEYIRDIRSPMLVSTPDGPREIRWLECVLCRSLEMRREFIVNS